MGSDLRYRRRHGERAKETIWIHRLALNDDLARPPRVLQQERRLPIDDHAITFAWHPKAEASNS